MAFVYTFCIADILPVLIDRIAGQVDFIIPIDTGAALVQLSLVKQAGDIDKRAVAGQVEVGFDVIYHMFSVVKGREKAAIGQCFDG